MQELFSVDVECHSGYKADEYPKRFYRDGARVEIEEILDRWHQADREPDLPPANYFKVRATDNKIYLLKYEIQKDQWYLWIKGESMNI